jgi:RND superfamily putative drug exporter
VIGLARWCFVHRKSVIAGWLLVLIAVVGLSQGAGSRFSSDFSLPGTDSQAAVTLLEANFPTATGEGDQIVIQAEQGDTVRSPGVKSAVTAALAKVAKIPGVEAVRSPYSSGGSTQISRDGTVAFANVSWHMVAANVTNADAEHLVSAAISADSASVHISLGGQSISTAERASPGASVGVGIIAALVILLVVFGGALLSALMPLLTAIVALVIGTMAIGLVSHAFTVPSVATDLALLIGLGVGVDYGLFIVSRHRALLRRGRGSSPQHLWKNGALRRHHGVHCAARAAGLGSLLPLRAVGVGGYRGGPDDGHCVDFPTGHARIPRA